MQRTIRFRGKTKVGKEWVYGYVYEAQIFIDGNPCQDVMIIDDFTVIPETIGQFTGLTDKNGKEIYEGDVVASVNYDGTISKNIVFYHDGNQGYGCYLPFGNDMDSCMGSDVKVIGNIHDNPELLK